MFASSGWSAEWMTLSLVIVCARRMAGTAFSGVGCSTRSGSRLQAELIRARKAVETSVDRRMCYAAFRVPRIRCERRTLNRPRRLQQTSNVRRRRSSLRAMLCPAPTACHHAVPIGARCELALIKVRTPSILAKSHCGCTRSVPGTDTNAAYQRYRHQASANETYSHGLTPGITIVDKMRRVRICITRAGSTYNQIVASND